MPLYDQFGNVVSTSKLKRELAGPTISGVRSILSEHPAQGLTPGRLGALLREAETGDAIRYLELAEEMEEKNLHYLAVLGTRKRQVAQLDVKVMPAGDDAEAKADAELVQEWLDNEPLEDELIETMDALGKGFSVTEIMWDMSERQWWPERLEFRDPRWFEFDDIDGRTLHMRDLENRLEPLAPFKFVVHRFQAKSGLPIRGGFARMVAWWYLFSNYAVRDWVEFISTYGQPFRIGKFPPGAGEEDKAILLRALTNLGTDAAAMIPESMMLEFAQVSGSGGGSSGGQTTAHGSLLEYVDALISKAVLGQTLTTEAGNRGARSLGEVHDEVRRDIERSDAFALSQTLSRDIARPLVALNRGERNRYPRIVIGREDTIDIARVSDAYAKLSPLGLATKASQWYEILGLEAPEDGDDTIGGQAPPDPERDDPENGPPGRRQPPEGGNRNDAARAVARAMARIALARGNAADDVDDAIDEAIDELLAGEGWEPLAEPAIAPLLEAANETLARGGSLADFRAGLPALLERMDDRALVRALERMGFSARLSGQAGLDG